MVNKLENQVLALGTSYSDTKYQEATQILANIDNRTSLVQKKAERITEETQTLLDSASNALESLNKMNKTLSGIDMVACCNSKLFRKKINFDVKI